MPKHVPTFKHLLTTTTSGSTSDRQNSTSVNDLITRSRLSRPGTRDIPPHMNGVTRIWMPNPRTAEYAGTGGLVDVEDGAIHPAELLRRSNISHRAASRSTAGPAPPPSWIPMATSSDSSPSTSKSSEKFPRVPVTTQDLHNASLLFSHPLADPHEQTTTGNECPRSGPRRLVEHCLQVVLNFLEDDQVVYEESDETPGDSRDNGHRNEENIMSRLTLGDMLRQQLPWLETHLQSALLELSSLLPEGSPSKMSDASLKALLGYYRTRQNNVEATTPNAINASPDPEAEDSSNATSDWDDDESTITNSALSVIYHLPLTLHPNPHLFLRQLPNLPSLVLTSLNLAYSTLPVDLERLVTVLPAGLRDLGLAGVRSPNHRRHPGLGVEEDWRRGFGALGRKLIVLRFLDLSYPPFEMSPITLSSLLNPSSTRLPSLKLLGLRQNPPHTLKINGSPYPSESNSKIPTPSSDESTSTSYSSTPSIIRQTYGDDGGCFTGTAFSEETDFELLKSRDEVRKRMLEVIRGKGRKRWIEVIWD